MRNVTPNCNPKCNPNPQKRPFLPLSHPFLPLSYSPSRTPLYTHSKGIIIHLNPPSEYPIRIAINGISPLPYSQAIQSHNKRCHSRPKRLPGQSPNHSIKTRYKRLYARFRLSGELSRNATGAYHKAQKKGAADLTLRPPIPSRPLPLFLECHYHFSRSSRSM